LAAAIERFANGAMEYAEEHADQQVLTFRCAPELQDLIPRPIPAVLGLPDWYRTLPQKALSSILASEVHNVKKCPPFIDAMTCGFLIPLAIDLTVQDGEFTWNFEVPKGTVSEYTHSPISFHDPCQVAGTPFFDEDRFIIKFNGFWTVQTPPGYSLLFTHPANRGELPFTTLTGLVDCDAFHDVPIHFPARWHDTEFNGVLPKGTPVAQCIPVKREAWTARFEDLNGGAMTRLIEMKDRLARETDVYRRQFRARKR
jgi:hypothetical protein